MKQFLDSYKKEIAKAKQEGLLDEQESDPLPFALYVKIAHWSLVSMNIFVWVFTVLQWNCLGRSISIDPLSLHNFSPGGDSIKVTYDQSKKDKEGRRVTPKNVYANPFDPRISVHFALCC